MQSQIDRLKARQEKCQQLLQTTNTAVDTEFQEMRSGESPPSFWSAVLD